MTDAAVRRVTRDAETGDIQLAQRPRDGVGDTVTLCTAVYKRTVGIFCMADLHVICAGRGEVIKDQIFSLQRRKPHGALPQLVNDSKASIGRFLILRVLHAVGKRDSYHIACEIARRIADGHAEIDLQKLRTVQLQQIKNI